MAGNLTSQVRGIAKVVTAVANGDLKRKLVVEAKGEIAALSDTINEMIDTLATFADQVTTVAREVGVEGQLGGQAKVPGRRRDLEGPDGERQPARRQPDHPGPGDRRGRHRRHQGRPDPLDHRRGPGRGRRPEGQHQRDDPQPQGHHPEEHRAGLAQDEPGQVHPHAPGPARPDDRHQADPLGAGPGRLGAARRLLHDGAARRDADAEADQHLRLPRAQGPAQRRSASARAWSASAPSRRSGS